MTSVKEKCSGCGAPISLTITICEYCGIQHRVIRASENTPIAVGLNKQLSFGIVNPESVIHKLTESSIWTPDRVIIRLQELGFKDSKIPLNFPKIISLNLRPEESIVDFAFGGHWNTGYSYRGIVVQERHLYVIEQNTVQRLYGRIFSKILRREIIGGWSRAEIPIDEELKVVHHGDQLLITWSAYIAVYLPSTFIAIRVFESIRRQMEIVRKSSLASQLEKLIEMKVAGNLSEIEFTQAKRKLTSPNKGAE